MYSIVAFQTHRFSSQHKSKYTIPCMIFSPSKYFLAVFLCQKKSELKSITFANEALFTNGKHGKHRHRISSVGPICHLHFKILPFNCKKSSKTPPFWECEVIIWPLLIKKSFYFFFTIYRQIIFIVDFMRRFKMLIVHLIYSKQNLYKCVHIFMKIIVTENKRNTFNSLHQLGDIIIRLKK